MAKRKICTKCFGTGIIYVKDVRMVCPKCLGEGWLGK